MPVSEFKDRSSRVNALSVPNTVGILFAKPLFLRTRLPRFVNPDMGEREDLPNPPVATNDLLDKSMIVIEWNASHVMPVHEHHTADDSSVVLFGQLLPQSDHATPNPLGFAPVDRNPDILFAREHSAVTSFGSQLCVRIPVCEKRL